MAITARDIHEKEFAHAMRGYKESEVDDFLDQCAAEVDRLSRENQVLRKELDQALRSDNTGVIEVAPAPVKEEVIVTEAPRSSSAAEIGDVLLLAKSTAEELVAKAHSQADRIVSAAEGRASEIVGEAATRKRDILETAKALKEAETSFRERYRSLLEKSLANIKEIQLDADIDIDEVLAPKASSFEFKMDSGVEIEIPAMEELVVESCEKKEPEKVESVVEKVKEPKVADPGILETTSFAEQIELDDDFDIEEID